LHGQLFLSGASSLTDLVPYHGLNFWALGPFPAVVLMPAVQLAQWCGVTLTEAPFHFAVGLLVFTLAYALARKFRFSSADARLLTLGFCLASPFLGVWLIPWSWFFAQVITTVLLLLAIYEWQDKKRLWLIGLLLAAVLATRFTAGVGVIYFILAISLSAAPLKHKFGQLLQLCLPIFIAAGLLGLYNFARFDSPFETGYSWQTQVPAAAQARDYGVFSWQHVPGNFYYLLLNGPHPVFADAMSHVLTFPYVRPDPWGMSLLITSPYLLYLFLTRVQDRQSKLLWVTILLILLPLLLFYGSGYFQFGYRYALDFFPWVFLLLLHQYSLKRHSLSLGFKLLLILPAVWNIYLLSSWLL